MSPVQIELGFRLTPPRPGFHFRGGVWLSPSGRQLELVEFYDQLKRDGMTVTSLAEKARVGRAALTEIFNARRSGKHTWKHILPLLSAAALVRLQACNAWGKEAEAVYAEQLKLGSTWNGEAPSLVELCVCGVALDRMTRNCKECRRRADARYRKNNPLEGEARKRANARSYLHVYVKRGKVVKTPCADCGSSEVEAHHVDYSKPLDVIWLCRTCHEKRHSHALAQ